jgi:hypothetical protein
MLFISHVEEDTAISKQLADGLEAAGCRVWYYERDSLPGIPYPRQIIEAIRQCDAMVVMLSRRALRSEQVGKEIMEAHEQTRRFFIPILMGITHAEFRTRRPDWAFVMGGGVALAMEPTSLPAAVSRILLSLERREDYSIARRQPQLLVMDAEGNEQQTAALSGEALTVGRESGNHVRLQDQTVSRFHARIEWDGTQVMVVDLNSKNGTWLGSHNITPKQPTPWPSHELLFIGRFQLRLAAPEVSEATEMGPPPPRASQAVRSQRTRTPTRSPQPPD